MKLSRLFLVLTLASFSNVLSQEKVLTVEDVVLNSYSKLLPKNLRQLNWLPNTDSFVYVDGNSDKSVIIKSSAETKLSDTLITLDELNGYFEKYGAEKMKAFPLLSWQNEDSFNFWNKNIYYSYNSKYKKLDKILSVDDQNENLTLAPNQKYAAFTKSNNLFLSINDKTIQITNDSDTNIVNGQAVHRNEFGINGGIFWSPKSNYMAFYRMDQTMVTDYPIVEIQYTPAKLKNIKYPMAGQTSHHVTIGIYEIATGKTTWLQTGTPLDQYLTNLCWSPDEKYFFVAHLNRDQNHMEMKKYDATTGNYIKTLFEEKDNEYVEPLNPPMFLPNSNNKFLWFSQRDGFNHLYLYDIDGNMIKQVTQGKWVATDFNGFDKDCKNIYVTTTKDSPLERHAYKVNLGTGKMGKITKVPGTHNVMISSHDNYFIDSYTNISDPRVINLLDKKYDVIQNLLTSENPLKEYKTGQTKIYSIKNDDGVEFYCRMILPPGFDETKKYPVIVYVYGGPHSQGVTNTFGVGRYHLWFQMMAEKGYIIFELDNRGTSNRGIDFEQATFRKLGTVEVADQMTGINHLKSLPYVDANRIGVYGWSYGGFMTTSLMLRTNDAFKVGACGGAVIDWKFYEVMYTERYMDTPQTNPDGYKEASLLNYVDNLNGKLLLVHGTSDPTVVWQNTLSFAKAATQKNKPLDYYPYIGHGHGVGGRDALHLYNKITNYFIDNL